MAILILSVDRGNGTLTMVIRSPVINPFKFIESPNIINPCNFRSQMTALIIILTIIVAVLEFIRPNLNQ